MMLRLPPPVWAIAYLLAAFALSHWRGWSRLPDLPSLPFAAGLIAIGVALSVSGAILFRREETELNPVSATNRKLVTSGPFRFTRNPMYLGLVCVSLGVAFWVGTWPMFLAPIATFATVNWVHIPFEEAKMQRQFGTDFQAYIDKVRRWI